MTWFLREVQCAAGHMGPALQPYIFVGQGPCALPGVRYKAGRRGEDTPPYGGTRSTAKRGGEDAPSCCSFMLCAGGGVLDAPSCCSFMMRVGGDAHIAPPLRRGCKG